MSCREFRRELVESARTGSDPGVDAAEHVSHCPDCAQAWEVERQVTRGLRAIRAAVDSGRTPAPARERLAAAFARQRRRTAARRAAIWTLAAAAALVLAILGRQVWNGSQHAPSQVAATPQASAGESIGGDDFVSVPYSLPLSAEEIVSVVRVELPPAAFVRMGFAPIQTAERTLTADFVVGEDGLPRAVRLVDSEQDSTLN
jgi:hypothetical protein